MKLFLKYSFYILTYLIHLESYICSALQCYSCEAEDANTYCVGAAVIQSCSRNQDRCLTQVIYSRERGKLRIDKSCSSIAGCEAATEQLGKRYFCDKSRAGWGCVECCEDDICNVSGALMLRSNILNNSFLFCFFPFLLVHNR